MGKQKHLAKGHNGKAEKHLHGGAKKTKGQGKKKLHGDYKRQARKIQPVSSTKQSNVRETFGFKTNDDKSSHRSDSLDDSDDADVEEKKELEAIGTAFHPKEDGDVSEGSGDDEMLFVPPCLKNKKKQASTTTFESDDEDDLAVIEGNGHRDALTKLDGSQFRWLNELLYTTNGNEAFNTFQKDKSLFKIYHNGYKKQVEQWPLDPLDRIISYLKSKPKMNIADLGCGAARLAATLKHHNVSSFDLVAANPSVIECDISKVPLEKSTQDAVVFCLSLMGTNYVDYIIEGRRILKDNGLLIIAEVVSRLETIGRFIRGIEALGFVKKEVDDKNKMFVIFIFTKTNKQYNPNVAKKLLHLKPCLYKKR